MVVDRAGVDTLLGTYRQPAPYKDAALTIDATGPYFENKKRSPHLGSV